MPDIPTYRVSKVTRHFSFEKEYLADMAVEAKHGATSINAPIRG